MSVLSPTVGRMTPKTDIQQFAYTAINSAYYVVGGNSISFWDMWNGLIGSTNGTTYGTTSQIGIQMARENWASLHIGIYIETAFNQNITLDVYQMYSATSRPFSSSSRDVRSKLMSVIIPQTAFFRFALSDAVPADGGVLGGSTAANNGHYRMVPGLACPFIGLEFTAAGTPSAGRFFAIEVCRSS